MTRVDARTEAEGGCDTIALSREQLRFYYLHQLDPSDPDIYICRAMRVSGPLDISALAASVAVVASRHDVLRGVVTTEHPPRLHLAADVAAAFVTIDLTDLPPGERAARCSAMIASATCGDDREQTYRVGAPFPLDRGPLFRVTAIRLGDLEHVVITRFHHLIVDGASARLFASELWASYRGALSYPPRSYREFVAWEDAAPPPASHRAYWAPVLADARALAIGGERPTHHTGEAITIHLDASDLLIALRRICRALHTTPYTVVMAALQAVLYRMTGSREFLVATPVACRPRVEHQRMIGVLIRWIAVRARIGAAATFRDLVATVRRELPDAYAHQCPYDELLAAGGDLPRDPSCNPLFQIVLNYATQRPLEVPAGLAITEQPTASPRTPYDLSIRFEETGDRLLLDVTCYRALFDRGVAEQFAAALVAATHQLVDDPALRVDELALPPGLLAEARPVVIAATFTAELIRDALAFWLERVGLRGAIEFVPAGQMFHALVAPDGAIAANRLGITALLVRCDDWDEPAVIAHELATTLAAHVERTGAEVIVITCPPRRAIRSDDARFANRAAEVACGEATLIAAAARSSRLHVHTWQQMLARYPVDVIDDPDGDRDAQAPYHPDAVIALATTTARAIYAVVTPAPKVLVLDCDNTLWGGVVGEDGVDGVSLGASHRALQEVAHARHRDGTLLALASKNNEADVWAAFARPDMVLARGDVAAHRINWEPKSANLRALASELGLGEDSFLFVDDSPAECAEVRAACPTVTVLELPADLDDRARFLAHAWPLDPRKTTATDRERAALYVAHAQREQLRNQADDLAAFIASLAVEVRFVPITPAALERVAQLTLRTNQFNTTTRRRSEAELRELIEDGWSLLIAEVTDRFGDYGIVGAALSRVRSADDLVEVDSMLVSCRALGRGVEHAMVAELGRAADAAGVGQLAIEFAATAKNAPAQRFLRAIGTPASGSYTLTAAAAVLAPDQLVQQATEERPEAKSASAPSSPRPASSSPNPERWQTIARDLNTVSKIRDAVRSRRLHRRASRPKAIAFQPPANELEATIAAAWCDALALDVVGIDDDYFAIGGDSIRSLAVVARLRHAGLAATVIDLLRTPTVRTLAAAIAARTTAAAPPAISMPPTASTTRAAYPFTWAQDYVIRCYAEANLAGTTPSGIFHVQDRLILDHGSRGRFDLPALARAIDHVVRRTPVVRSTLIRSDGELAQLPRDIGAEVAVIDLADRDSAACNEAIRGLLRDDRARPFDPDREGFAMIRFYVVITAPTVVELLVTAHHAFCDGWSLHKLYRQLVALYAAYTTRDDDEVARIDGALASAEHGFRDVVTLERGPSAALDRAYWQRATIGRRPQLVRAPSLTEYQPRARVDIGWLAIERAFQRARAAHASVKAALLEAFAAALDGRTVARPPIAVVTNGRRDDVARATELFGLCWTLTPITAPPGGRGERIAALHHALAGAEAHTRHSLVDMFGGCDPHLVATASFNLTNFHHATNDPAPAGGHGITVRHDDPFGRFPFAFNCNVRLFEPERRAVATISWAPGQFDEATARGTLAAFVRELSE